MNKPEVVALPFSRCFRERVRSSLSRLSYATAGQAEPSARSRTMSRSPLFGLAARCTFVAAAWSAGCIDIPAESAKPRLTTYVEDWRNEIIYQVLVDRFANGDVNNDYHVQAGPPARYQGGDWKGLEDHLDYIHALGVTTLWISPVVRNVDTDADVDAYHGYWAQDLTALNPHFGDLAALRSLTEHVHALGMKIVEDVVVNHLGQVFFYDMNMNGKPDIYVSGTGSSSPVMRTTEFDPDFDIRGVQAQTPLGIAGRAPIIFVRDPEISRDAPKPGILGQAIAYHGLGRITNFNDDTQSRLGDFPGGLKDLATENPEVRQTLIDSYLHWVEEVNFDGLRLDTIKHVEHEFWQAFSPEVRRRMREKNKTNFILFGEALDGRDDLLGSFTSRGSSTRCSTSRSTFACSTTSLRRPAISNSKNRRRPSPTCGTRKSITTAHCRRKTVSASPPAKRSSTSSTTTIARVFSTTRTTIGRRSATR